MRDGLRTMQRGRAATTPWLAAAALAVLLAAAGRCPAQSTPAEPAEARPAQQEQADQPQQDDEQARPSGPVQRIQRIQRVQRSGAAQPVDDPFGGPAAEPVELDDALMALVSRLDHPDYDTREQATEALFEARPTLGQLQTLLSSSFLSAEQRNRIVLVARRKLLEEPRGALGIRMLPKIVNAERPRPLEVQIDPIGARPQRHVVMEVMDLLPDLPARKVLNVGDRITQVDGEPLTNRDALVTYVQERRPGESVELTVERIMRDENGNALREADGSLRYQEVTVSLTLGSADKLIDPRTGRVDTDSPVYDQRRRQAELVAERFAADPQVLELESPPKRTAPQPRAVAMMDGSASLGPIEQHKYIKELRRDIHMIRRGDLRLERRLAIWQSQAEELQRQVADLDLPPDEREFLQRVHERFIRIILESNLLNR